MNSHGLDKKIWRKTVKERLQGLTTEERDRHSQVICERILQSAVWKNSETIALFTGLPMEPQLQKLAEAAWKKGRIVVFPQIDSVSCTIRFQRVEDYSELQLGSHGIWEPKADASWSVVPLSQVNLICAPGLAFDRRGARLGRGGGYYDRLLEKRKEGVSFHAHTLGVFFSVQEIPEVPEMSHDVRMDAIVTEQELLLF